MGKICKFCVQECNDHFKVINETIESMLYALQLKLNLTIMEEPVICKRCYETLQQSFKFKLKVLSTENLLQRDTTMYNVENHKICQFCMTSMKDDSFRALTDANEITMLWEYFPELNLQIVKQPRICLTCHKSLEKHFSFIKKCLNIQETIIEGCKSGMSYDGRQIKSVDILQFSLPDVLECKDDLKMNMVKVEEVSHDDGRYLIGENSIKKDKDHSEADEQLVIATEEAKIKTEENASNSFSHHLEMITHDAPNLSEITCNESSQTLFSCKLCNYKGTRKYHLTRHMLIHKAVSDQSMYSCKICTFRSKWQSHIRRHMLTHDPKTEEMHKCGICSYVTKHKYSLKNHMVTHKDVPEVEMYKCEECPYKTKHKYNIKHHMLIHKSTSEAVTYKCETCNFKTRHKCSLKQHILSHKDILEVVMHKCEECSYRSRHRHNIKLHMVTHKSMSEVKMYKCDVCAYETKWKQCLKQHLLIHKDVPTYDCSLCWYKTKYEGYFKRHMVTHQNSEVRRS